MFGFPNQYEMNMIFDALENGSLFNPNPQQTVIINGQVIQPPAKDLIIDVEYTVVENPPASLEPREIPVNREDAIEEIEVTEVGATNVTDEGSVNQC